MASVAAGQATATTGLAIGEAPAVPGPGASAEGTGAGSGGSAGPGVAGAPVSAGAPADAVPADPAGDLLVRLWDVIQGVLGLPYAWGGSAPATGFDCSGLVQWVFAQLGVSLPRTSFAQYAASQPVAEPQPGDLVFFQTYAPGASHVGIYLGDGVFVTSADQGVVLARLSDPYWKARYLGARRVWS